MKLKIDLEEKILELVTKENLDLKKFCDYIGLSIMDLFKVCEGRYIPRLECVFRIAGILHCSIEDLYELEV